MKRLKVREDFTVTTNQADDSAKKKKISYLCVEQRAPWQDFTVTTNQADDSKSC